MNNLFDALKEEISRNEELLKMYIEIGQPGIFGSGMIQRELDIAKLAISDMDTVAMLATYKTLKENK